MTPGLSGSIDRETTDCSDTTVRGDRSRIDTLVGRSPVRAYAPHHDVEHSALEPAMSGISIFPEGRSAATWKASA